MSQKKSKSSFVKNKNLISEVEFQTSRSSGPGGQSVNKVNTKVTLRFDIRQSRLLKENEKNRLLKALSNRTNKEGVLILSSDSQRSQIANKEKVVKKFKRLVDKAFQPKKKRIATKPSKASIQKRLEEKRQHSEKKQNRQNISPKDFQ